MKLRLVAVTVVAASSLSACSIAPQSDRRWVSNSHERMFTRIPKSWKTFEINPYKVDRERLTPLARNSSRWSLIIDSAPKATLAASRKHLAAALPAHLVAEMSVRPLPSDWATGDSSQLREDVSPSLLRQYSLFETVPSAKIVDPVKSFLDGNPSVEVVLNSELAKKNGLRGSHIRYNFEVEPNKWITIDQNILVDRATSKLYRLIMKCESLCFKRDYNEVKRISESWTVRK